jgi:transcription elongation GreA/GreB family factor
LESPVGKALLGRRTGDKINVETPGGARQVQILKVA